MYNLNRSDWNIDKASDQRMVYVPKDTVIEFMKKVGGHRELNAHFVSRVEQSLFRGGNSYCDS